MYTENKNVTQSVSVLNTLLYGYNREGLIKDWEILSKLLCEKHKEHGIEHGDSIVDPDVMSCYTTIVEDQTVRSIYGSLWTYGTDSFVIQTNNTASAQLTRKVKKYIDDPFINFNTALFLAIKHWVNFGNVIVIGNEYEGDLEFRVPHPIDTALGYQNEFSSRIGKALILKRTGDTRKNAHGGMYNYIYLESVGTKKNPKWNMYPAREGRLCEEPVATKKHVYVLRNVLDDTAPYGVGFGHKAYRLIYDQNLIRMQQTVAVEKSIHPTMFTVNSQIVSDHDNKDVASMHANTMIAVNTQSPGMTRPPVYPPFVPRLEPSVLEFEAKLRMEIEEAYKLPMLDLRLTEKTMSASETMTRTNAAAQLQKQISEIFYDQLLTPMLKAVLKKVEPSRSQDDISVKYNSITESMTNSKYFQEVMSVMTVSQPFVQLQPSVSLLFKSEEIIRSLWTHKDLSPTLLRSNEELQRLMIDAQRTIENSANGSGVLSAAGAQGV